MEKQSKSTKFAVRPPIVSVLGHVDHGKTSLLDFIRKSKVAAREAGGITQSIGATTVKTAEGKYITFIDTPGHAAFSAMRSRGAKLADIIILVVAADDGVKPQTKEALDHILASNASFVVAFTKIDMPSASLEQAQNQLEELGVYFEGRGGDVPFVAVSSKTGEGVDKLLDLISLIAEVNDIKADASADLEAIVIETSKDKRGQMVSVVVRNGILKTGQMISAENVSCKVKGLFDDMNKSVKEIQPGFAGAILGFTDLPAVGAILGETDKLIESRYSNTDKPTIVTEGQKGIFLKAQTAGSLEALAGSLPKDIVVVGSSVGDIVQSDVMFAKSANVPIYAFESSMSGSVNRLAETEGVIVKKFRIIYELIKELEELLDEGKKKETGRAEVLAIFPYENKKVAGSKVQSGFVKKGDHITIMRGEKELATAKIVSMRKIKNVVDEAKAGEELGIIFEPQIDFTIGDVLISSHT